MVTADWPAEDYAIGSYIQAYVADRYLHDIKVNKTDRVLDVGCGNCQFTKKILACVPAGEVIGLDASENMIKLAQATCSEFSNLKLVCQDVATMKYHNEFDLVVSFWCLQWMKDVFLAFNRIYDALQANGRLFALFPSGDDAFMATYYAVRQSGQFPELANFISPVNYSQFDDLEQTLPKKIPFSKMTIQRLPQSILLPSLDVFRKFLNGIGFYQGQVAEKDIKKINEAMVEEFAKECREKHQGQFRFDCSIYLVSAVK